MSFFDIVWIAIPILVACLCAPLVARWLVWTFEDRPHRIDKLTHLIVGKASQGAMDWKLYAWALLAFNLLGIAVLMAMQLAQGILPLNPMHFPGVPFDLAFNTAVSFVTNTNWQAYSGEATLSYLTQMVGLGTQNFVSAAVGFAAMVAIARGIRRNTTGSLGNFWIDLTRVTICVLLPLSFVWALVLVSQGVVQNFASYLEVATVEGAKQVLPMGPASSQIAIKQLGTNGGGFFGVNSTHPFENPTFFSNLFECIGIILLSFGCPIAFGQIAGSKKHGWSLFAVMLTLLLGGLAITVWSESHTNPLLSGLPLLEGKELRFGQGATALWAQLTSSTSNGSVNGVMSSLTPLAGGVAMLNIMLGEIIFGGVGSGVYGMFLYAVLTVFIAGLMVGRSPEFLGKKIEAPEIRLAVIGVLLPSVFILVGSAIACSTKIGLSSLTHSGPHGLSEILYGFSSATGNNGSAFGGLSANTPFYNYALGAAMFFGRFGVLIPALWLGGLLSTKRAVPESAGTFPVSGVLFSVLLLSVSLIVGALTFLPALSLGPIVEHLQMFAK